MQWTLQLCQKKKATVDRWRQGELDHWAKTTLPTNIKQALADSTGKHNPTQALREKLFFVIYYLVYCLIPNG